MRVLEADIPRSATADRRSGFGRPARSAALALMALASLAPSCRVRGVADRPSDAGGAHALEASFSVITWNVAKMADPALPAELRSLVAGKEPDVLLIQEALPATGDDLPLGASFAPSWRSPAGGSPTGVMTLSAARPSGVLALQSCCRELLIATPKAALVSRYPLPGGCGDLLVVNAHLLNFERWGTRRLRHQLEGLRGVIASHEGPLVLAGDLNTWSSKRLALVGGLADDLGLREVTGFAAGRTTAGRGSGLLDALLGVDPDLPLDRIYYRGLELERCEVLADVSASDHLPVLARFRVAGAASGSVAPDAAGGERRDDSSAASAGDGTSRGSGG